MCAREADSLTGAIEDGCEIATAFSGGSIDPYHSDVRLCTAALRLERCGCPGDPAAALAPRPGFTLQTTGSGATFPADCRRIDDTGSLLACSLRGQDLFTGDACRRFEREIMVLARLDSLSCPPSSVAGCGTPIWDPDAN
jgi:hypothetical protein